MIKKVSFHVFLSPRSHSSAECGKLSLTEGGQFCGRKTLALSDQNPNGWHRLRSFASIAVIHRELAVAVLCGVANRAIGKQASACKRKAVVQNLARIGALSKQGCDGYRKPSDDAEPVEVCNAAIWQ